MMLSSSQRRSSATEGADGYKTDPFNNDDNKNHKDPSIIDNITTEEEEEEEEEEEHDQEEEKYSQVYFEHRIQTLQSNIVHAIPSKEKIDSANIFSSILQSYDAGKQTLESTKSLLSELEKKDNNIDPAIIDQVKNSIQDAQDTIDRLNEAGTNCGSAIVDDDNNGLLDSLLHNERDILECACLIQATPNKLAEWCCEVENRSLLDEFLCDLNCMKSFLSAGGPSNGNYGEALSIYSKIKEEIRIIYQKMEQDNNNNDTTLVTILPTALSCLQSRIALAVSLELATHIPIFKQSNIFVDPIKRFWYYVHAAQKKDELDKAFFTLTVWEIRKVINSNASNEDLTWGREYLRAYRPDEIWTSSQKWRYVMSVKTDVGYRHPDHEFNNYQELISAGGECGPRAFFGRFISKSWGIPTWGVRQPGHAAMSRWTDQSSGGWTMVLGAAWQYSWWDDDRYSGEANGRTRTGVDFLEESQARTGSKSPDTYYKNVVLLECLAECFDETIEEEFSSEKFWRSLALAQRKMMARAFSRQQEICKDKDDENDSKEKDDNFNDSLCIESRYDSTLADDKLVADMEKTHILQPCQNPCLSRILKSQYEVVSSVIVIPATSFINPSKPTKNVLVMNSFLGGTQLHLEQDGQVEYELPSSIVTAGTYALSVKVVNVHRNPKPLLVSIENPPSQCHNFRDSIDGYEMIYLPQGQEMEVQYTKGKWEQTNSIRIELSPGGRLKLSRKAPCWGLTIKEIILQPITSN
jgi:hypothetical protein